MSPKMWATAENLTSNLKKTGRNVQILQIVKDGPYISRMMYYGPQGASWCQRGAGFSVGPSFWPRCLTIGPTRGPKFPKICPESANCPKLPLYLQNDVSWAPGGAWTPERRGIQYGTHSALGASRLKSGAVCLLIAVLTLFPHGCPYLA